MAGSIQHSPTWPLFEALESRQLLAADLTGTFAATILTEALVPGNRAAITVTVANDGDESAKPGRVEVYAIPADGAFAPDSATLLGTRRSSTRIAPGDAKDVDVRLAVPPMLTPGAYRLVAVIDAADQTAEDDETNNIATSTVVEVKQLDFDLTVEFISVRRMPQLIVSGAEVKSSARVAISNSVASTEKAPRHATILVGIYARPAGAIGDSQDIALHTRLKKVRASNLKPGASRRVRVSFATPPDLPPGAYELVARVDPGNQFSETNDANNAAALIDRSLTVNAAFFDLSATMDGSTLPPSVVTGQTTPGQVRVRVTNAGNVPLPRGQRVDLEVALRPAGATDASADIQIGVANGRRVSNLKPGRSSVANIRVSIAPSLSAGDYTIVFTATPSAVLVESDVANNSVTGPTVTAGAAFVDLAATVGRSTLPAIVVTGRATRARVAVTVTNTGNVPLPRGQRANLEVALRPAEATDASQDVLIGTIKGRRVSGLKPGQSHTGDVRVTVEPDWPAGDYVVVVQAIPVGTLVETDLANNRQIGPALASAAPFADLLVQSADARFGPTAVGTAYFSALRRGSGATAMTIQNVGNIRAKGRVNLRFYFAPNGIIDGAAQLLGGRDNVRVDLAPGREMTLSSVRLKLPDPPSVTAGHILAVVEPIGLADAEPVNNALNLGPLTITPLAEFFDHVVGSITFVTRGVRQRDKADLGFGSTTVGFHTRGDFVTSAGLAGRYRYQNSFGSIARLTLTIERPDGTEKLDLIFLGVVPKYADLLGTTLRLLPTQSSSVWEYATITDDSNFAGHSGTVNAFYEVIAPA